MVISELPNQHMLPKSEIKNIHQDSEGYMWYGTDGGGICRDDGYSITVFRADFNTPELMEDNSITAITEDRVQRIWFGTKRGAYVLNKKDYQIEAIADDGIKSWVVNDIKGTKDGSVWISTGNYIYRYNSDMERTGVYNVEWKGVTKTVYKLYEDRKGTLWQLQRNGGLLKYDSKKDEFIEVEWPFKEWPSSIYEDYAESVYWIGTWGNGIIRFDPEEKDPNKVFTIQPETIVGKETFGKEVTSIILDSVMNYLWATTMDDLYVYTLQDGILKQLSISASFPGKKKMLNGVFTSIKINGNISKIPGYNNHNVILQPHETNVELFFSTLEPLETENVFYAFRYNDQKDWMYLPEGQNSIFLSRLVKGKYTLELKAIDANGIWQDGYLSIFIQRLPGWYETTWAYIIYIFLTGLIIFLMLWKYLGYRKEKQDIELKRQVADMKSEFFTNISHELRTPLTLVITPLETIMKKVIDAEIRQELQIVKRNAHNLLELINQLIDFKRIEIEKEKLILDETDMNVFLYSIFENFQWVAKEKKITFNYHTDVSGLTMSFDFDKMKKIANNLISNALKFTDEGGCVTISLQQIVDNERYYAMISIKDTGAGISEDELPFIFNRYHQSDKSSSNHGIGVGLHLVNEYVMLHQGTVTVRSVLGEGSVFTVRIPIYSEGKKRSEKNSLQADSSRKKVLIVEDNLEFRSYLRNELSQYYTIYEAINGKEGEKEALAKDPDIIVTDLMMPEMDGLELCRQIKNNIQISHIPVLLLTANNSIENEKRGYKEGADAYLNKPFDWEILLSRIKYLLEQKKDRQQEFFKAVVLSPENITISSPDEKLMKRALEVFEKNMDNSEYSIEEFSRDMGMSRNNLYRKIKAITGESPTDFLNSVRLKQAAVLLKEGHMNVNEIAYAVGFSTHSYFTQSFKKMFGVPPNKYKQ